MLYLRSNKGETTPSKTLDSSLILLSMSFSQHDLSTVSIKTFSFDLVPSADKLFLKFSSLLLSQIYLVLIQSELSSFCPVLGLSDVPAKLNVKST